MNLNSIFTFNIAIFIGIIAGSISSLLIGPKVWMMLEKRAINKKDDEEDDDIKELLIKGINS